MLIQKMLGMHKIDEYAIVEYTDCGAGVIALCRHIGNLSFKNINSNTIVNELQIRFYKNLTSYVGKEKGFITDLRAKKLAEPFYDEFHKEYLYFLDENKKDETNKDFKILGICIM